MRLPGGGKPPAERPWRVTVRSRARLVRGSALAAAAEQGCAVGADGTVTAGSGGERLATLANAVVACTARAETYADTRTGPVRWLTGAMLEGAWNDLHAAEEHLWELLPDDAARGQVPLVVYQVRRFLRKDDPRRIMVEKRAAELAKPREALTRTDRALFANAVRGVYYRNSTSYIKVRSLRNTQFGFAALFVLVAVVLALLPDSAVSLCVPAAEGAELCPTGRTTPSGGDVPLVELVGLIGGALAAALAVTGTRRPAAPYAVVVGSALLKTTLGAVTAVLGLWFLRAGFVPGVNDVDTQAELLVWAVVFGYAQQVLTRLIDRRAEAVTDEPVSPGGGVEDEEPEVRAPAR